MTLLKFYATWCGPCKVLTKNLLDSGISYTNIDVDEQPELCKKYNIRNVPVMIIVDSKGNEVSRKTGVLSPTAIKDWWQEHYG